LAANAESNTTQETMMKPLKLALCTSAFLALAGPAAFARQAATPGTVIHDRQENQQDRIAGGVKSGQLTAGETARLEHKERRINREVHHMRSEDGGQLTPQDRRIVSRQQNRVSRQIYRDKHNRRVQ